MVSGTISLRHWASATERVLNLGLPWRVLRPQLVNCTEHGMVDYQQWMRELSITEPKEVRVCTTSVRVCLVCMFLSFYLIYTHTQLQEP